VSFFEHKNNYSAGLLGTPECIDFKDAVLLDVGCYFDQPEAGEGY